MSEAPMTSVPEEAVQAAAEAIDDQHRLLREWDPEAFAFVALEAAAPVLAAHERAAITAHLQGIAEGADHGGAAFRMFTARHRRLAGQSGPSALLAAVADEIRLRHHEGDPDD